MASLHSLQDTIDNNNWFNLCFDSVQSGDAIILLEDAVTITCHLPSLQRLNALDMRLSFYVIDIDLQARGLTPIDVGKPFEIVGYQDFVELSLHYDKVINWA